MMMDETERNLKIANQAWRKKPRRSAPKSRLGCKTCKIRRIKCDLSQPSCLKCRSTGRTCDGYTEIPPVLKISRTTCKIKIEPSRHHNHNKKAVTVENRNTYNRCPTISTSHQKPNQKPNQNLILHPLHPLMILPTTEPAHAEAVRFFEYHSIKRLNEYNPCQSWRETLMFFSQTVPAVRSAAVALALVQREYLDRDGRAPVFERGGLKDWLPDRGALFHYNRAIQLLLTQESACGDGVHATAITLLVCYLFICFDHLAGNDVQAVKHLRGGVELARTIDKDTLKYDHDHEHGDVVQPPKTHSLIRQVARQIRRLDMQAVTFMVDWTPAEMREEEIFTSPQPPLQPPLPLFCGNSNSNIDSNSSNAFHSLDHAADTLQILVARVVRLCNTGQQVSPLGTLPPLPASVGDVLLAQLETWAARFENMLLDLHLDPQLRQEQQGSGSAYAMEGGPHHHHPLVSLLRLQYSIARILVATAGPDREVEYDRYTPQFERCVALARAVAAASSSSSSSYLSSNSSSSLNNNTRHKPSPTLTAPAPANTTPAFTPEIGIVPVLYIIGVKCRHPVVRREALNILRGHRIREAVWDSGVTARVVERVIQIEEGGEGEGEGQLQLQLQGEMVRSEADIPAGRRVQALSFVVDAGGAGRVDITYTFCAREGVHVESLVI
ncbi:hypothetical protein BJY00DRAFT_318387 [Aspergillus carlsbadensis]|nr:hypothetical protein BJY00DRAFT_318387 [Aspergillus carlsbadensis]